MKYLLIDPEDPDCQIMNHSIAISPPVATPNRVWLMSKSFDLGLIVGTTVLPLILAVLYLNEPLLFTPIFLADIWLLGYHHVISTYTRLFFDSESLKSHSFLVWGLPPATLAVVAALGYGVGFWLLTSIYFYWQWFHYGRQSWGLAQTYSRKSGVAADGHLALNQAIFYLLPLWGLLQRSHQNWDKFLGTEIKMVPVSALVVDVAAAAAILAVCWWGVTRLVLLYRGQLPVVHTLYMISHFVIFYVSYIYIDHLNAGWLVINIWHNIQYIAFVWLFNNNRFKNGIDPKARFLSYISQRKRVWLYLAVCLGISTLLYSTLPILIFFIPLIIIFQAINFHHYLVDGFIWKLRNPSIRKSLGVEA
jgi:hypothetical protein